MTIGCELSNEPATTASSWRHSTPTSRSQIRLTKPSRVVHGPPVAICDGGDQGAAQSTPVTVLAGGSTLAMEERFAISVGLEPGSSVPDGEYDTVVMA